MSVIDRLAPALGDEDGFETFYRSHVVRLVRFLIIQGATPAIAAEAAQDAMTDLYRCWSTVEWPLAWVRRAGVNYCARYRRRNRELLPGELPEPEPLMRAKEAEEIETNSDLLRLLAGLSPRQREVLAYRYDGETTAEIAEAIGISEATVRATFRDAKQKMAEHRRARLDGFDD